MTPKINVERLFFAIELTVPMRKASREIIKCLAKQSNGHRHQWTKPKKLHVTLRFLGNVIEEKIPECLQAAAASIGDINPFEIALGPLTVLPIRHPKLIALSIPLSLELAHLFYQLETSMTALGYPAENRPFFPHITLGRAKGFLSAESYTSLLERCPAPPDKKQRVDYITLFRSEMLPEGSIYTPLKRLRLVG